VQAHPSVAFICNIFSLLYPYLGGANTLVVGSSNRVSFFFLKAWL
jgi:hypothetical protein